MADTGPTFFERGFKIKERTFRIEDPKIAQANVGAVAEWNQAFEALRAKHELLPPGKASARSPRTLS